MEIMMKGWTLINIKLEALKKIIPAEKIYKNKWEALDFFLLIQQCIISFLKSHK